MGNETVASAKTANNATASGEHQLRLVFKTTLVHLSVVTIIKLELVV